MSLVNLKGSIPWPGFFLGGRAGSASFNVEATLDAAGEYVCLVFQAEEAMTISHVGFRNGTVVASGAADVRVETVDAATGLPSGTLWATNTNAATGALTSNTTAVYALTASASVAAGEWVAIKIAYASGTSFTVLNHTAYGGLCDVPYKVINTGTPTISAIAAPLLFGVGSSSTAMYFIPGTMLASNVGTTSFDNSTAGAQRGIIFTPPMACKLRGITYGALNHVAVDRNLKLYNADGSSLIKSTAIDGDFTSPTSLAMHRDLFDADQTLVAGTQYRLVLEPSEAANVRWQHLVLGDSGYRSGIPGGTAIQYTTFTTGGGWDDTDVTTVPLWDLLISALSDTAAGGVSMSRVQGGH
jgi:hypothetical protein